MLDYLVTKPFLIYENCNMNKQLLFQVKWVQYALKNIKTLKSKLPEMSALKLFYGGQFTWSSQLIKPK